MAEKSKQSAQSTNKYKFVRLTAGNVIWKDPASGFILNALAKESYANLENVPTEAKKAVEYAVKKGLLEYTSEPDKHAKTTEPEQEALVMDAPVRGKWTDKNSDEKFRKSPSFTNRNKALNTDEPLVQQAFKLLAAAPAQAIDKMSESLAALNENEKEVFLKACLTVEKSGNNTAAKPRTQVMDFLKKTFVDLGLDTGLGNVSTEEDALVKDVTPVKFDM